MHNCPHSLVHSMRFDTKLDTESVKQFHTDESVRKVDATSEPGSLIVSSWLTHPKTEPMDGLDQNDDAFLFDGEEPSWSFAYDICLTSD